MTKINWQHGTPPKAITKYLLWRDAVERADQGDSKPLTDLFRSRRVLGPEARLLIADLLERHRLRRKKGRPRTPAYRVTRAEARSNRAAAHYRYFRKTMPEAEAIQEALREQLRTKLSRDSDRYFTDAQLDKIITPAEFEALRDRVRGRRGSTRRSQKRSGKP